MVTSFISAAVAIFMYVLFSLLSRKKDANMDKILHRREYEIKEEKQESEEHADHHKIDRFWKMIGVNSREFSRVDRGMFLYMAILLWWNIGSFAILLSASALGYMSDQRWLKWWFIQLCVMVGIGFISCVWFVVGGLFDLRKLYSKLTKTERDYQDDGTVSHEDNEEN